MCLMDNHMCEGLQVQAIAALADRDRLSALLASLAAREHKKSKKSEGPKGIGLQEANHAAQQFNGDSTILRGPQHAMVCKKCCKTL